MYVDIIIAYLLFEANDKSEQMLCHRIQKEWTNKKFPFWNEYSNTRIILDNTYFENNKPKIKYTCLLETLQPVYS